jgi:hypothetical protein
VDIRQTSPTLSIDFSNFKLPIPMPPDFLHIPELGHVEE